MVRLNQEHIVGSDKVPPNIGPKMNPKPNAIPIKAKFLGLSADSDTSLMAEKSTDKLPPKNPGSNLERNSKSKLCWYKARENKEYPIAEPNIDNIMIRLRP